MGKIEVMEKILFYSVNEPYGEFSNFAPYAVRLKNKTWPTVEHYYQAQKFAGQPDEEQIRRANTPGEAARMGRDRKRTIRKNWDCYRDEVMLEALKAKFSQHLELERLLLSTAKIRLVEHTDRDRYWGDGGDGSGKNRLGWFLMRVRTSIRSSQKKIMLKGGVITDIEAWLDMFPDDLDGLKALAKACMNLGQFENAEDCYRLLVAIYPKNKYYRFNLSEVYAAQGKWRSALFQGRQARSLNGGLDKAYSLMGCAYLELGRYEKAIKMLKTAISKCEPNADDHSSIARAYTAVGSDAEAGWHYEMAFKLTHGWDDNGLDDDFDQNWMLR